MSIGKILSIFFTISLLTSGYCLIQESSKMNENIVNKEHKFTFWVATDEYEKIFEEYRENDSRGSNKKSPNLLRVHDFLFLYDFPENKGKISFSSGGGINHTFNKIYFDFFAPIEITNIYSIVNPNNYKGNKSLDYFNYNLNGYSTTEYSKSYVLKKFNSQKRNNFSFTPINKTFKGETIIIEFESDFEPDGIFYMVNPYYNSIRPNNNKETGNINFILGDEYENDETLSHFSYIEKMLLSSESNIKLKFIKKEKENNHKDIIFRLNSINKKTREDKALYLGLGISFFTAGIIMTFQTITNLYNIINTMECKYKKLLTILSLLVVIIYSLIYIILPENFVFSEMQYPFLSDLTQFTILILTILILIAIYKIQLAKSDEENEKIKKIKKDLTIPFAIGVFTILAFLILMFF